MKVFITGIGGFIGGHLKTFLEDQGHQVDGSSSGNLGLTGTRYPAGKIYRYKLGEPVNETMFAGMEVVIHCAHDFEKGAFRKNIEGTMALAEAAVRQQVGLQLFISSLSSRPDARSEYGKAKFAIEQYFTKKGGLILRPGTVLGPGGIFAKMVGLLKRWPVMPLLDGGQSQMYVIGIDDLCRAVYQAIRDPGNKIEYNLYYPEKVSLKDILTILRQRLNLHTLLIPFPSAFLIAPLALIGSLGFRLPVDIDNLRGFITSQTMIHQSDLSEILESYASIEEILKKHF